MGHPPQTRKPFTNSHSLTTSSQTSGSRQPLFARRSRSSGETTFAGTVQILMIVPAKTDLSPDHFGLKTPARRLLRRGVLRPLRSSSDASDLPIFFQRGLSRLHEPPDAFRVSPAALKERRHKAGNSVCRPAKRRGPERRS